MGSWAFACLRIAVALLAAASSSHARPLVRVADTGCTYDYSIVQRAGSTAYDGLPLKILHQEGDTVDFVVGNTWTTTTSSGSNSVEAMYVVLNDDDGSKLCYAESSVPTRKSISSSLQAHCSRAGIAMVRLYATDAAFFDPESDTATIPTGCSSQLDADVDVDAPGVEYTVVLQCTPTCDADNPGPDVPDPFETDLEVTGSPVQVPTTTPTTAPTLAPPVGLTTDPTATPATDPTVAPVDPTLAPVDPTQAPIDPTQAPVDPTQAPIDPTQAPVNPTQAPVDPTQAPVDPTQAPVDPTQAPVDPTQAPVDPTQAPVNPTQAPVDPTQAPVDPTQAPVNPTQAPVDPTQAPVNPTQAPVDPTQAPIDPTQAPIDPTQAPVNPTQAPVNPTQAPVDPTQAPVDPTQAPVDPTQAPVDPTQAPVNPTQAPNNNVISATCPPPGDNPLVIGTFQTWTDQTVAEIGIPSNNNNNVLCTLVELTVTAVGAYTDLKPIGRSYNGHDWEPAPGDYASRLWGCTTGDQKCRVALPAPPTGRSYVLKSYDYGHELTDGDRKARFLERATFGPTKADINAFTTPTEWIADQFAMPITSHRRYFRERATDWYPYTTRIGIPYAAPCETGSRYRNFAMLRTDFGSYLHVRKSSIDSSKLILTVYPSEFSTEGQIRTVVDGPMQYGSYNGRGELKEELVTVPLTFGGTRFLIGNWRPEEGVGGRLILWFPQDGKKSLTQDVFFNGVSGNPRVHFDAAHAASLLGNVVVLNKSKYQDVMTQYFFEEGSTEVLQLIENVPGEYCKQLGQQIVGFDFPSQLVVASTGGGTKFWLHTPMFNFKDNHMDSPLLDGGKGAVDLTAIPPSDIEEDVAAKLKVACSNVARTFLNEDSCRLTTAEKACTYDADADSVPGKVLICGSPDEVASKHTLESGTREKGGFTMKTGFRDVEAKTVYDEQKNTIWAEIALHGKDQLAQRMAYALSQILVVADDFGCKDCTENSMSYYDIFTRNAFGNYFDVLKQVTRHPLMSKMLTFINGVSTAYAYIKNNDVLQADENYAREIMQLFSIGVAMLNDDGTLILDGEGNEIATYTNFDISEYAKVYVGFKQQEKRGNIETDQNEVDPLRIEADWKDTFPKLGFNSMYIGDGYPLCADLPKQLFLKKGAMYRVLGAKSNPDFASESNWVRSKSPARLSLDASSALASAICNKNSDGQCEGKNTVVLPDDVACTGVECSILEPRTFEVAPGLWYEYIRPPCVNQAFYNNGKSMFRIGKKHLMCGNPSQLDATTVCCNPTDSKGRISKRLEFFSTERVSLPTAEERCAAEGLPVCNLMPPNYAFECNNEEGPYACDMKTFHWLLAPCSMSAKVSPEGNVAIVHQPAAAVGERVDETRREVDSDTKSFFRTHWQPSPAFAKIEDFLKNFAANCGSIPGCVIDATDGNCQCNVGVEETAAIGSESELTSVENVLSVATIGAVVPEGTSFASTGVAGVKQFPSGPITINTIFEVTDSIGRIHCRKNILSIAKLGDGSIRFRNPVSFWSLADVTKRDGEYELDAALEHYFYHPNVASFLGRKLAQRFGISNPSPTYLKAIATAFKTGTYGNFGSNKYGCLKATVAAIILHRESQDHILDADPIQGHLQGPFLKIIKAMRASEYTTTAKNPLIRFNRDLIDTIGEEPHHLPGVFSFFGPFYIAPGRTRAANLYAPEAEVLNGPTSVTVANGMMSFFKYGSARCGESFFGTRLPTKTGAVSVCVIGDDDYNFGSNKYNPANYGLATVDDIVNDLAMTLTSGRLSPDNRAVVKQAYEETLANGTTQDRAREALINAQQLIALSPEFSSNSLVRKTKVRRAPPVERDPTGVPYKAVIHLMLNGGLDSFNVLVPKTCSGTNSKGTTVDVQYKQQRGSLAFKDSEYGLTITPGGTNQPCTEFAIHEGMPFVKELYDDGDLLFFANTGVVNKPNMNRDNWDAVTKSRLFGHDAMDKEVKKNDPYDQQIGTGIMGRLADFVYDRFNGAVNAIGIQGNSMALAVNPTLGVPMSIVGRDGPITFPIVTKEEEWFDIESKTSEINGEQDPFSGIFGDTWSGVLMNGINDGKRLTALFETITVNEGIWTEVAEENPIWRGFKTLAKMIKTKGARKVERDTYTIQFNGFDHHQEMKPNLKIKLVEVDRNLKRLVTQLKEDGLWDQVTIVVASEFGRTMTPNSSGGSDHGWGGNYFILGGKVKGGRILGQYPSDLTSESPLNASRNTRTRFIPTLGWDNIYNGIAGWFADGFTKPLAEEDLDYVLPNRKNCINPVEGQGDVPLFTKNDLFDA